ncbi:MAG: hypothetical protein QM405_00365 [Euryarchaeota archaeon]|jgi:hypothetical protein|nr:hypothetical protein [Euryarchaeota archaeon]
MNTKALVGLAVLIVVIGGVSAFGYFSPAEKTSPTGQSSAPAAPQNLEEDKSTQNTVNAQGQVCAKCGGKGYLKCGKCGGDGVIGGKCAKCGGDGKVYYDENCNEQPNVVKMLQVLACHEATCPSCGGTGGTQSKCPACGGDGKITCPGCGGDGHT